MSIWGKYYSCCSATYDWGCCAASEEGDAQNRIAVTARGLLFCAIKRATMPKRTNKENGSDGPLPVHVRYSWWLLREAFASSARCRLRSSSLKSRTPWLQWTGCLGQHPVGHDLAAARPALCAYIARGGRPFLGAGPA